MSGLSPKERMIKAKQEKERLERERLEKERLEQEEQARLKREQEEAAAAAEAEKAAQEAAISQSVTSPATQPVQTAQSSGRVLPTGALQIKRPELPDSYYGIKPVASNFNTYNKDLRRWLKEFSDNNQSEGGCAITISQVVEIAAGILKYDLGIEPTGFKSQRELLEEAQRRIGK